MIPLSPGFYCEQPQILLAGKKYIFGPQGSLLAQSLQLAQLPRLTSEDCAAPCWRHPSPFTPCSILVGGEEGGTMPLLHWVQSRRRPSGNHRTLSDLWRQAPTTFSLYPSVPRTLPTIHEIPTPHPGTAPEIHPGMDGRYPKLRRMYGLEYKQVP